MSNDPALITDGNGGWRLDARSSVVKGWRPPRPVYSTITSVRVRAMMATGMDTLDIARELKTTEAVVWNAMARAGA